MIRFIRGTYAMNFDGGIIVETSSGIGFAISVPANSPLYRYKEGDEIKVFTSMAVKEDDVSLYGFHNKECLDLFELLTTVNGIGAKAAMALLGALSPEELKRAIAFEDVKEISKANGIGKKTAERLILELKDKVGRFDNSSTLAPDSEVETEPTGADSRAEAIRGLIALGYTKAEAYHAISQVKEENLTSGDYIKKALKYLF